MNREIEKEKKSKLKVREKEKSGKHDKISKPLKSDIPWGKGLGEPFPCFRYGF